MRSVINSLILVVLILIAWVSYKNFNSNILQAVLAGDFNTGKYSLNNSYIEKFDLNFPNISETTIPMIAFQGRYLKKNDSIRKSISLFKKSLKINPYLKLAESELSKAYLSIKKFDSAYFYGRDAFYTIPINNNHRFAYFNTLIIRKDSIELDNAFQLIKDYPSSANWIHYLLARNTISQKNTPYTDSIFELYIEKFKLQDDLTAKAFKSKLVNGDRVVASAVDLSFQAEELFNKKEYDKAGVIYELASSIDSYDYTYFQNAALSFANTDQSEKALELFDKVIYDFKIKDGKAYFYKGILLAKLDRIEDACRYLKIAVDYNYSGDGSLRVYQSLCAN